jgi:ABC-type Mn2+/Zn2+ transport system permease subunit
MSTTSLEAGSLVLSLAMATAAGLIGCFAVMRRMTLAADALSHVALPGIAVAVLLRFDPLLGAIATLAAGTVLIWAVEWRTAISTETIVGVVFSVALAVGAMMTSGETLLDALFGGAGRITGMEVILGLIVAAAIVGFVAIKRHALVVALVSPEIALTCGINVQRLDLMYLLMFALTVVLGLRYLGVLLMGSLMIIPAATARRLAGSLNAMFAVSTAVAVLATLLGTYAATVTHRESGPLIITIAGALFFLSLLRPRVD